MKHSILFFIAFVVTAFFCLNSCDKITVKESYPVREKDEKPAYPVQVGTIRGYFGNTYRTFYDHIEKVQPIDSFSNCYFYGACNEDFGQINLIRCDNEFVLAIYILGYSLDSLPLNKPVKQEFGRYTEIQFYAPQNWNSTSPKHYNLIDFYGKSVIVTDTVNDIITGTFEGNMTDQEGASMYVSEGEFKLKIFRKYMPCGL